MNISSQRQSRALNRAISRLTGDQDGLITRIQLRELGLAAHEIDYFVNTRRLEVVHRGVYAVDGRLTERGRCRATVLAMGDGAVLAGHAAAAHWGMLPPAPGDVDVIVPRQKRKQRGIRPCHSKLPREHWRTKDGIPTTTPERTLLDLAATTDPQTLDRAIREAHYLRLASPASLARFCLRNEGRRGCRALREAVGQADLDNGPTHEELERRFRRFLKAHKLPIPCFNGPLQINGRIYRPDCRWPHARLIIELDSRQAHATPHAFEEDRARDRVFTTAGYRVMRITWRQLRDDASELAGQLLALLVEAVPPPR